MHRFPSGFALAALASTALAAPLTAQSFTNQSVASTADIYRNPDGTGLQQGTSPTAYALNGGSRARIDIFVGDWLVGL